MNDKTKGWIAFVVVIAVIVIGYLALSGPPSQPDTLDGDEVTSDTITIGFLGALSGDVAFIGENVRAAVETAVDEINTEGGINGKQVEVIYEDSGCDSTMAANAANKLVNIDKVTAIIGATCTPGTLAAAPIVEEGHVPMISYSSTAAAVTDAGDYVFRTVPSDAFQAVYAATYAAEDLGAEKVAILHCLNDWCQGLVDTFESSFTGEIVANESFEPGSTDLRSQITKIQAAEPDLVYFTGFTASTIAGIGQMDELGLLDDVTVLGGDTWVDVTVWQELGDIANGIYFTQPKSVAGYPESFTTAMAEKLGEDTEITTYAPRAYDATMILAWALETAGTDGEAIKDALYTVKDFDGIADSYTFDGNGDPTNASYDIMKIEDSAPVMVQ